MKKYILIFLLAFLSIPAFAQKVYFVYLQSETDQPFYIKLNDKVQSSSAAGYLILPRLKDTTYSFTLGFPLNKWPEQNFSVTINRKDHGYLVKNFGEKGWGLFDLQTLEIIMAAGSKTASVKAENNDGSGFTAILSKAAGDPSLKEKPQQPKVEEKKAEPELAKAVKEEIPVSKPVTIAETAAPPKEEPVVAKPAEVNIVTEVVKEDPPKEITPKEELKTESKEIPPAIEVKEAPVEEYKISTVTKRSESSTTEGFGLVYLDKYDNGNIDTVRLLIPNPKQAVYIIKEEPKEEKKMLDIPVEVMKADDKPAVVEKPAEEKPAETKPVENIVTETKPAVKSNCTEVAAEADFFKLRKVMAAEESDDGMIAAAKKYFKARCYTTEQIKNLGALFLTDQGKYNFFDAAYPYAADAVNYTTLQTELKDEYYINRFRAMLRN